MDLYRSVANLTESAETGNGYKNKLFSSQNKKRIKSLHYLCVNSVKKKKLIDDLLLKVGVSDVTWLKRIILYEFLWGRRKNILNLKSNAVVGEIIKHRQTILKHLHHIEKERITEGEMEVPRYIRINSEKMTMKECEAILKTNNFQYVSCPETYESFLKQVKLLKKNEYMFDFHIPNLLVFNHNAGLKKFSQNDFIRQDKASCLVIPLLAPLPGSTILDMCAAPGYKTQHAAAYIFKLGKIYSIDNNKERFSTLNNTIKLFGLEDCCVAINKDVLRITEDMCPNVEYILLDAPCSGTGMANTLIKHSASEERLEKLHNLQVMLLKHALKNFSCVRRIVYSTCSVTEEENEKVVSECLEFAQQQEFQLVPLASAFKGSFHSGRGSYPCSPYVLRTSSEAHLTNGFFLALFERTVPPKLPNWNDSTNKNIIVEKSCDVNQENKHIDHVNRCSVDKIGYKKEKKSKNMKSKERNTKHKQISEASKLEIINLENISLCETLQDKTPDITIKSAKTHLKRLSNKNNNKINLAKKLKLKRKSRNKRKLTQ